MARSWRVLFGGFILAGLCIGFALQGSDDASAFEPGGVPRISPSFTDPNQIGPDFAWFSEVSISDDLVALASFDKTKIARVENDGSFTTLNIIDGRALIADGELVTSTLDHFDLAIDGTVTATHVLDQTPATAFAFDGTNAIAVDPDEVRLTTRAADGTPTVTTFAAPPTIDDEFADMAAIADGIAIAADDSSIWTWRLIDNSWVESGRIKPQPARNADTIDRPWPLAIAVDDGVVFAGSDLWRVNPNTARGSYGGILTWTLAGDVWNQGETIRGYDARFGARVGARIWADNGLLIATGYDYTNAGPPPAGARANGERSSYVFRKRADGTWGASAKLVDTGDTFRIAVDDAAQQIVQYGGALVQTYDGPFPQPELVDRNVCAVPNACDANRLVASDVFRGVGQTVVLSDGQLIGSNPAAAPNWTFEGSLEVWDLDTVWNDGEASQRLRDPSPGGNANFAYDMDVDGDLMAVVANPSNDQSRLLVYRRDLAGTWELEGSVDIIFGLDPVVVGDQVFARVNNRQRIYGQRNGTWQEVQALTNRPLRWSSEALVILSGNEAWRKQANGEWQLDPEVQPLPSNAGNRAVNQTGDTIAWASGTRVRVGALVDGNWTLQAELTAPANSPWQTFGTAVAIDGDRLLVSETSTYPLGPGDFDHPIYGVVHLYERTGDEWNLVRTFTDTLEIVEGRFDFGRFIAIDGDTVAIARSDGAHYVHRLDAPDPQECTWTVTNNTAFTIKLKKIVDGRELTQALISTGASHEFQPDDGDTWLVRDPNTFERLWRETVADCEPAAIDIDAPVDPPGDCTWTFKNNLPDEIKLKLTADGREVTQHRVGAGESQEVDVSSGERWTVRRTLDSSRRWRETVPENCVDRSIEIGDPEAPPPTCTWTFVNDTADTLKLKERIDGREIRLQVLDPGQSASIAVAEGDVIIVRRPADAQRLWRETAADCADRTISITG